MEDARRQCLQAKERGLGQAPSSQPSEVINSADILISDSQPPELWENKFRLFKSPSLLYFVKTVLAN